MPKKFFALMLVVLSGFILQACGRDVKPEEQCNFVQNNKAQRVSWGSNTPVVIYLDSSVPAQFYSAIEQAVEQWNQARGRQILKIGGVTQTRGPNRDGANVIHWMSTWEADRAFEQARTTVHWSDDQIYEADIRINDKNFDYVVGSMPGRVDVVSLLVHELGHVLGLSHTEESGSVMLKSLANNTERRIPSTSDINALKCEY
jgi:predicted Zn-dependent protease